MKKPCAFLLLLAMALLSASVFLPLGVSSEPAEIDDFGYQSPVDADVLDDETSLRFLFTVGSLGYTEVGVVVSKSVAEPTYDGSGCYTYKTTTVHHSIVADGETRNAPDGRFWVAVKLTGIPHHYFDGDFYLRAFVRDGGGIRYSDVEALSVCMALGHTHVLPWDADGDATMLTAGTLSGHCAGCDLDVTKTGVKREPIVYNSDEPAGPFEYGTAFRFAKGLADVRDGGHFYPTGAHPDGQDLYFEYSFLWNETLANWDWAKALAEMKIISIRNTAGKHREFYYLYARDNNDPFQTSNDCPYAGHFDFSTNADKQAGVLYGPDAGYASPLIRSASPYIWDENWFATGGWHRIGVRFHEEAANDEGNVAYSGFSELYLDGVLVWRIKSDMDLLATNNLLLYTAEVIDDELVYHDNDDAVIEMRIESITSSTAPVYIAVGDIYWSCGDGFVLDVEREPFPAAATLDLDESVTVPASFSYRPKTAKPANSFTIATWNIGHFSNGGSKNSSITNGNAAKAQVKYKTYIDDVLGADIICLNEYSARYAPSYYAQNDLFDAYTEVAFEGEQRNYSCNALYSKLPLADVTVHEFACNVGVDIQYTDAVEATDYYYVTGELEIGGETVTVVAVHLSFDDKLYDVPPYIDTVCQNQMRELIEVFASTERVLILGDWNAYDYSYFDLFADAGYSIANRNEIPTCTGSATHDLQWPVDNMVAKGLTINDFRGEPTTLSDHVAVIATVTLAN